MSRRKRRPYRLDGTKHFRALRDAAMRRQNMHCYWCNREMKFEYGVNHPLYPTGDHLIPLHAGGTTRHDNIVAACRECNNGRHPELNRTKEPFQATFGQEINRSPFEVLAKFMK